jgi:pimeloyl-ACP methyl ester carboxylesterase
MLKRGLSWLVICLLVVVPAGFVYQVQATRHDLATAAPPGRLRSVGDHRLHIWCTGTGSPTVILDAGLGGTAADWGYVQPGIAKVSRVCSYDRAGMGYSDPGPRPRTSRQIASELAALLDASDLRDPVVLVGASIGGWNMRVFASEYPGRAAGLVLVDARHEDQGAKLKAVGAPEDPPWIAHIAPFFAYSGLARLLDIAPGLPINSYAPEVRPYVLATRLRPSVLEAAASEMLNGSESEAQVRSSRRPLDIPLIVLSAGRRSNQKVGEVLNALQRDQARLSKHSCLIVAEHSEHAIGFDQPQVVVDAVHAVVEVSREPNALLDCARLQDVNG